MAKRKGAHDLKLTDGGKYTMSVAIESMEALEKISRELEKTLGVRLTRAQVLKHVISAYNSKRQGEDK